MTLRETLTYEPAELHFGTSGLRSPVKDMTDLECFINATGFLRFLTEHDGLTEGETIYIAGDLRESTDRIMQAMFETCRRYGLRPVNCGLIPTPAVAYFAIQQQAPCIMVTGSHIPRDRNGIKFYKRTGEVLKEEEAPIKEQVTAVRAELYVQDSEEAPFDATGTLKTAADLPTLSSDAETAYKQRFLDFFPADCLVGKQIIVYQQSAVGRDIMVDVLSKLGAEAIAVERSEFFIPIDTEHVTDDNKAKFKQFAAAYPQCFAIVSTDGDSDRPFVIDETGAFHSGDLLGCVVAGFLGARFAAVPLSCNDAVDTFCREHGIELTHTQIGSPYVIAAMEAVPAGRGLRVSWEVNGGFLLGDTATKDGRSLDSLPTRDALMPIICAILAADAKRQKLSELFANLPARFTAASLIDGVDPQKIDRFQAVCQDHAKAEALLRQVFTDDKAFDGESINLTDGLRVALASGDVVHYRFSGNSPQFRVYTNADSQEQADQLVRQSLASEGYMEKILAEL